MEILDVFVDNGALGPPILKRTNDLIRAVY